MSQRKMWTQEEDRVLRLFKEERGEKKWSLIARKMQQEFEIEGRTGKQCRERYHNHLDHSILAAEWTSQQEQTLFRMHSEVGNKWSLIAERLSGRTDNGIKNHFYSKLRKAVRRLNKLISEQLRRGCREIKISFLYKILEISESRFKTNSKYDEQLVDQCVDVKNRLYQLEPLAEDVPSQEDTEDALALTSIILELNRLEDRIRKNKPSKPSKPRDSQGSTCSKTIHEEAPKAEEEEGEQPFYNIFKRVCEQLIQLDRN